MSVGLPTRYRIRALDPHAHPFEVGYTIEDPARGGQRYRLPTWVPGSYLIREFARAFRGSAGARCLREDPRRDTNPRTLESVTDVTLADAPLDSAWLTRDDDASPVALARRAAWLETPDAKERPPD